jgi:hypothetical protein
MSWCTEVPEPVDARPVIMDSLLLLLGERGLVTVLELQTGSIRGHFVHRRGSDAGGMAWSGDRLFVAHGRRIACYDVSKWR